jgi:hypothetical protein
MTSFSVFTAVHHPHGMGGEEEFHSTTHTMSISGNEILFFCIYDKTPKYISKWDYHSGSDPKDFGYQNNFSS